MQPWRPDLSWVLPDLAIGADFPPGEAAALARAHGLGAVIDLRQEACDRPEELAACGLKFLHLPTPDLCGVTQRMLDRGVAFARRAARTERRLLVHCRHGIGRSATLVLCILVDRGHAPIDALRLAKDAREKVSPSEGQYQAWAEWIRRRAPQVGMPSYHEFGCIAYRHLVQPA
jgi:protein tyrosine phosphatase (PTP) superfamily phosphohydrolase (DUF442 family)